jgi:hypothetical protein
MKSLINLPVDIQRDFGAALLPTTADSAYRLIRAQRTAAGGYQERRIIALVVDENNRALAGVPVAFAYSTAQPYQVGADFTWSPFGPRRADVFPTEGSGQIEHIQGGPIKEGEPGGVSVYVLDPAYPSDVVTGCGMLADHTGLLLVFQLQRVGQRPVEERLAEIEARLSRLELAQNA